MLSSNLPANHRGPPSDSTGQFLFILSTKENKSAPIYSPFFSHQKNLKSLWDPFFFFACVKKRREGTRGHMVDKNMPASILAVCERNRAQFGLRSCGLQLQGYESCAPRKLRGLRERERENRIDRLIRTMAIILHTHTPKKIIIIKKNKYKATNPTTLFRIKVNKWHGWGLND